VSEAQRDFLFIQSTTEVGGAEAATLNLFTHSAELRARSVIANLGYGQGDLPLRLRAAGAEVIDLPPTRLRNPIGASKMLLSLRRLARARGVRVVAANGAHPQVVGGVAARLARVKSVFLVNMIHRLPLWSNEPLDMLALRGPCDLMLVISRASMDTIERLRPGVESRLFYWGTPLRETPDADARAARAELGIADDEVLVGVFGRLQRWKAQDVFVEAAARVAVSRPKSRFVVVGGSVFGLEPEYFEELKSGARARGLDGRLTFTGFRNDVARLMAACDVVCHTSRVPEPFGLVVIEAMAQARPVIATRGGGPSEIFADDSQGLLVSPDDAAGLAAAITTLVDDPEKRRRMGIAGLARVKDAFTIDVMARNLIAHFDSVAGARAA